MTSRTQRPWLPLVLVLTAAALALNLLGSISLGRTPDFGYSRVGDRVTQVVAGGPADRAGFEEGDLLLAIEGAAIDDPAALAALTRPEIGELRHYRLRRGDDEVEATLVPTPLPAAQRLGSRVNSVIGLAFLATGLTVYWQQGGALGSALVSLGLAAAVVMGNPPFRAVAPSLAPALMWLWSVLSVMAAASFLHFAVLFPSPRPVAGRRWLGAAIYGPVAVWALVVAGLGRMLPAFFIQLPFVLLAFALLLAALLSTRADEPRRALVRFLWLTVAALVPFVTIGALSATGVVVNPLVNQFGNWTLALVPIAIGWSVLGRGRSVAPAQSAA